MHFGSFPCREKNKLWKTGPRFDEIEQRLPSLEAAVRPIRADKEALVAVGGHINRAVWRAVHGLEKSLLSDPKNDISCYLAVLKRLEEALRFLEENCGFSYPVVGRYRWVFGRSQRCWMTRIFRVWRSLWKVSGSLGLMVGLGMLLWTSLKASSGGCWRITVFHSPHGVSIIIRRTSLQVREVLSGGFGEDSQLSLRS